MTDSPLLTPQELAAAREPVEALRRALSAVLLDQDDVIRQVLTAVLARGHVLLEGLPGLGKTELCKALARLLGLPFKRLQFTPDLLPGDITGTAVLDPATRTFSFRQGPLFASVVLADEVNRSSPKTQSALLEAMSERSVTVLGTTHALPSPFFVLATQNPIELEGTYPLPEAQLDRFLLKVAVPNVAASTLAAIASRPPDQAAPALQPLLDGPRLEALFGAVDRVHLPAAVAGYIGRLVEATHPSSPRAPPGWSALVRHGASPRAALGLAATGRALALAAGKPNVGFDEVRALAPSVLGHRLVLSHQATLEAVSAAALVARLLAAVSEVPDG